MAKDVGENNYYNLYRAVYALNKLYWVNFMRTKIFAREIAVDLFFFIFLACVVVVVVIGLLLSFSIFLYALLHIPILYCQRVRKRKKCLNWMDHKNVNSMRNIAVSEMKKWIVSFAWKVKKLTVANCTPVKSNKCITKLRRMTEMKRNICELHGIHNSFICRSELSMNDSLSADRSGCFVRHFSLFSFFLSSSLSLSFSLLLSTDVGLSYISLSIYISLFS